MELVEPQILFKSNKGRLRALIKVSLAPVTMPHLVMPYCIHPMSKLNRVSVCPAVSGFRYLTWSLPSMTQLPAVEWITQVLSALLKEWCGQHHVQLPLTPMPEEPGFHPQLGWLAIKMGSLVQSWPSTKKNYDLSHSPYFQNIILSKSPSKVASGFTSSLKIWGKRLKHGCGDWIVQWVLEEASAESSRWGNVGTCAHTRREHTYVAADSSHLSQVCSTPHPHPSALRYMHTLS